MEGLKRFITNKNVVTILLVLVALGLLFWGYTSTIKKETNPIQIPVSTQVIGPRTKITDEMVTTKTVPGSLIDSAEVIRSSFEVVGKYTYLNVTIPVGGMFYDGLVVDEKDLPGSWIDTLERGKEWAYYYDIEYEDTLGNSIAPGSFIDLYMVVIDEENSSMMIGKLIRDMKVLVTHDDNGKDVFVSGTEDNVPSHYGFALNYDMFMLMKKIKYISEDNVEFFVQPRGTSEEEYCKDKKNCMTVATKTLRDMIDAKGITVDEDPIDLSAYETQDDK